MKLVNQVALFSVSMALLVSASALAAGYDQTGSYGSTKPTIKAKSVQVCATGPGTCDRGGGGNGSYSSGTVTSTSSTSAPTPTTTSTPTAPK